MSRTRVRLVLCLFVLALRGPHAAVAVPRLNEFVARPAGEEGEWIELIHSGPGDLDLGGWTLNDGTGRLRTLPEGARLRAGSFLILAARPDSLLRRFVIPDSVAVVRPDGWPVLNDRDGGGGAPADVLVLRDAAGALVDSVAYFEAWLPATPGVSLERADPGLPGVDPGAWGWSLDPQGATPGRPNTLASDTGDRGALDGPAVVDPARVPARFGFRLPAPGTLAIWLLDQDGTEVAVLREPAPAPAAGRWIWGAQHPLPGRSGLYFLCLRWEATDEAPLRTCRTVWVRR